MALRSSMTRGFTLIELSLVMAVLSLMLAGLFAAFSQDARQSKQAELQTKLDSIEAALINFIRLNNRLPCPATGTWAITNQYFGIEAATPGTCTGGTPAASFSYTDVVTGYKTVGGVVPVRTLGLSDDTMFDPWGGRLFYAVDLRATATSALTSYLSNDTTLGSITVKDVAGNTKTSQAVLLVMSYGPDGHGAYQLSGATRKNAGSTNLHEQKNCHCANDATPGTFDATFYQHASNTADSTDPLNVFDDTVRYYLRSQLLTAAQATYSTTSR